MKRPLVACLLLCTACGTSNDGPQPSRNDSVSPQRPAYPATRRNDVVDVLHGTQVVDPYRWLEDGASAEVKSWADAQDAVSREILARLPEREAIAARLRELAYVDQVALPVKRGGRLFVARRGARDEKWTVALREGAGAEERVVLDPNTWSNDGSVSLGDWAPSWDGRRIAYQSKVNNSDEATLHVMDVDTGAITDTIAGAKYARAAWTPDGDGFYYTWIPTDPDIPAPERPGHAELRFHRLGTDAARDPTIHSATGDPSTFLAASLSRDGRFLVATLWHGWTSSDVRVMDLESPSPSFATLVEGREALHVAEAWNGRLHVTTNAGAPRWRVLSVDPARMERTAWVEIVPERADATLSEASIVGGRLSLSYLKDVVSEVELRELDGTFVRRLALPGVGTASPLRGSIEKNSGHGGADMVRSWVDLTADQLAFALAHAR